MKIDANDMNRGKVAALFSMALAISVLNLALAETDRPQLLTRGFDRNYIVKYLGMYNYTIYDAVQSTKASAQRVMAIVMILQKSLTIQNQIMQSQIQPTLVLEKE